MEARRQSAWVAACALWLVACSQNSGGKSDAGEHAGSGGQTAGTGAGGSTVAGSGGTTATGSGGRDGASDATGGRTAIQDGSGGMHAVDAGSGGASSSQANDAGTHDAGASDAGASKPPFKGVANSPCSVRTALNVSWYYNWMQSEDDPCTDARGGAFVPMIWGHTGAEQTGSSIASSVASFVAKGYDHVLGFNEPDNTSQSNIPVDTAITLWSSFDNPAIKVATPGTAANANPGQAWFTDFMTKMNADSSLRADVLALHWYGWNAGSCDANASGLENYIQWAEAFAGERPIWITEWGCLNQSAPDEDTVVKFYQGALAMFARHPRVERYAWYPWATNCHLADDTGKLTALGKAYAAAPAYR